MPAINSATAARTVLAAVAYGEARGGGAAAMSDVLSVVMNRARAGWQATPVGVCLARSQFSCLNANDPNLALITRLTATDPVFAVALGLADRALAGDLVDETGGADSYFAVSIRPPYWAHSPATHTTTRWLHSFWVVEPRMARLASVPVFAAHGPLASHTLTADDLNAAELQRLGVAS